MSKTLSEWELAHLGLTEAGKAYVQRVQTSEPSRAVQSSNLRNTPWRHASHKMGCTIQAESTLERNFLVTCEYRDTVVAFWDQPEPVSITFDDINGRTRRDSYTTDVLVVERRRVMAYQVKYLNECEELIEKRPQRWHRGEIGYIDDAANRAFEVLGITHEVITESEISQVLTENYALLLQARRACEKVGHDATKEILSIIASESIMTIGDLLRRMPSIGATEVLCAIDGGFIAALIKDQRLADVDEALVSLDKESLEKVFSEKKGFEVREFAEAGTNGRLPTIKQWDEALKRKAQLEGKRPATVTARTLRRWRGSLAKANGSVLALIPEKHRRGNRKRRVSQADVDLMLLAIDEVLLVHNPPSLTHGYRRYRDLHKAYYTDVRKHPKCTTLPTFLREFNQIPSEERGQKQGGRRLESAQAQPVSPTARSLKPLRAFERAHIDHYKVDQHIVVIAGAKRKRTKRPWLTVMIDQATHAVLGISLSFRNPSRHSCAAVMRNCVKNHGRLPEVIVVDNGAEFQSVYFEALLARYGVSKQDRPPEAPRFGGLIESTFRSIKEELILALKGNTGNIDQGRRISPSHRAQRHACWSIQLVYKAYADYFFNHFNSKIPAGLNQSAVSLLQDSLNLFPCSGVEVAYDASFLIATAIPLDRRLRVDHARGVRHCDRWYFNTDLLSIPDGSSVDAMKEPWDDRCVYVWLKDHWVICLNGAISNDLMSENQMLNSILSSGSRDMRQEEIEAQQDVLEQEIQRHRASERVQENYHAERGAQGKARTKGRKRECAQLPKPSNVKPLPISTYQGDWDGYRKRR